MGRSPCCDKSKVKRGTWSPEEDAILKNYLNKYGTGGNWIALPQKAGLQRCGKSCRLRWLNYLRPDIKHGGFTQDEEYIICNLYNKIGSRWSVIASHLPGRTDNDVKNYWNTKLKKKFVAADYYPPTKSNMETESATAATSNTAAATIAASGAATTSQILDKTTVFQAPTNLLALQEYCFSVPFLSDASSVSTDPTNYSFPRLIVEGLSECSSGSNKNFPFSASHQDSSSFTSFCLGMDENGVKIDEYPCDVLTGLWSQEEARGDADLFSIFHVDSKPQGVGQSH